METEKALSYATLAAAAIGIIVLIYAILNIPATSRGFTEVYFEKPAQMPSLMKVNEKYTIPVAVVSKGEKAAYNYTAVLGGRIFAQGKFNLLPNEKKVIALELTPAATSWNLSSNISRRSFESFPTAAPLIEQGRDGYVVVYENLSVESLRKAFLMLPLENGIYTARLEFAGNETRGNETASLVISEKEVSMEYVLEEQYKNSSTLHIRKWRNRVQLGERRLPAVVWLTVPRTSYAQEQAGAVAYQNTHLNFREGLPGELYLQPPTDIEASYSYELIDTKAEEKTHLQKNATVRIGRNVSVERMVEEKKYTLEKAKLSIVVESSAGKSYEIHFWVYVDSLFT